jgi:hypothetical protein
VLGGVHCGIYKSSYNISNISYLNSPLHHSPLSSLPLLGIVPTCEKILSASWVPNIIMGSYIDFWTEKEKYSIYL